MQAKGTRNAVVTKTPFNGLSLFKPFLLIGVLAFSFSVSAKYVEAKDVNGTEKAADTFVFDGITYRVVKSNYTNRLWLDKNLGAAIACGHPNMVHESECYGDLYQWGRNADGHQLRDSTAGTTPILSETLIAENGKFITGSSKGKYDWTKEDRMGKRRSSFWAREVCPKGYKVPTEWEINAERKLRTHNHFLHLPLAGKFAWDTGKLTNVGTWGYLWSRSVFGSGTESSAFYFTDKKTKLNLFYRSQGMSIRCIQNDH